MGSRVRFQCRVEDVNVLRHIGSPEQLEALGVPVKRKEASWQQGEPDHVGPNFGAACGGSPEVAERANKIAAYTDVVRRRLWGES